MPGTITRIIGRASGAFSRGPRPADVLSTANAMLDALDEIGSRANLIRLQRLMVLAQGWSLALLGRPLFDARIVIVAGRPSIHAVHDAFRAHSCDPVTSRAKIPEVPSFEMPADDDEERLEIIRMVVGSYATLDGYGLGVQLAGLVNSTVEGTTVDQRALGNALKSAADAYARRREEQRTDPTRRDGTDGTGSDASARSC